ncbi:MAG: oxidoreductase [Rhodobacteraceae bacterium]|nr:oxidoreductase [Paracoccaceae bacterium]
MAKSLVGKTAIITGAANGIGLSVAKLFCEEGANVVLADNDETSLEEEVEYLKKNGHNVLLFCGDLTKRLTLTNLIAATIDRFENIDILVNALRQIELSDPINFEKDNFQKLFDQNFMVSLRLSQLVAKKMIHQNPNREKNQTIGGIINLSSIADRMILPESFAYSICSAAVNQLTKSMGVALAGQGIRVNAVAMGSIMSTSLREMIREDLDLHDQVKSATPLGRIGDSDEAAMAVLFLASENSQFITGQIITIDGGRTLTENIGVPAY